MISVVPYDSGWRIAFEKEAQALRSVLGERAIRIEHVGSTSIPGLAAKPVIDIQISVAALQPIEPFSVALRTLDYVFVSVGDFDTIYPLFAKPGEWPHTHHVHLCVAGGVQERKHPAFRDFLRAHPEVALEYAQLKRELARLNHGRTHESREQYSLAKTGFMHDVLRRAGCSWLDAA